MNFLDGLANWFEISLNIATMNRLNINSDFKVLFFRVFWYKFAISSVLYFEVVLLIIVLEGLLSCLEWRVIELTGPQSASTRSSFDAST